MERQVVAAAKQLFEVDGVGLMLIDRACHLRWASASDQTVQAVWDDRKIAAAQAYAGVVASLLTAAVTAQAKGRLAGQLQAALEHRWLIEQAKGVLMGREGLDARAAFERLRGAARSSGRRLVDVAREVTAGKPPPAANRRHSPARDHPPWPHVAQGWSDG